MTGWWRKFGRFGATRPVFVCLDCEFRSGDGADAAEHERLGHHVKIVSERAEDE